MEFRGFDGELVRFLSELKRHNDRAWFARNKARYEAAVREPVLAFVREMAPRIERITPAIFVSDAKSGGSMMRPYRDTRFTSGKEPYKTNVGIHFRHERGETAHAPGFWMHIAPGEFWLAVGLWRPEAGPLARIRDRIAESPREWLSARDDRGFRAVWEVVGDSLKRPPRGYDPGHPCIDDIKRKEFLGFRDLGIQQLYGRDLPDRVAALYAAATPFMRFLCRALGVRW